MAADGPPGEGCTWRRETADPPAPLTLGADAERSAEWPELGVGNLWDRQIIIIIIIFIQKSVQDFVHVD